MPDYLSLYQRHVESLKQVGSGPEHAGECPFPVCKGKKTPKFYVNGETGQFICHRCGTSGNGITFAKYFGDDPRSYYDQPPNPTKIDQKEVAQYHQNLIERPEHWRKPWKRHVLELLHVGWDDLRQSLVFPIYSSSGQIINLIHHKTFQNEGAKCTLYPAHLLEDYDPSYIVLCEGLNDCLSLLSIDIQAVTSTGGASSIPADISALRRFRRIYLCFDIDEAGDGGVDRWLTRLRSEGDLSCLRICELPDPDRPGFDVTNYLSLPEKNRVTFVEEVLDRARVGRPFTDVPDYIRQKMRAKEFKALKPLDRLVYVEISLWAARHYTLTGMINGMRVRIKHGEFYTSLARLVKLCPFYTDKQMRGCLERLVRAGFISQRDLKMKRGRVLTLVGWADAQGQSEWQSDKWAQDLIRFPHPPSISASKTDQKQAGRSSQVGK